MATFPVKARAGGEDHFHQHHIQRDEARTGVVREGELPGGGDAWLANQTPNMR